MTLVLVNTLTCDLAVNEILDIQL